MGQTKNTKCYIEEYKNERGQLCARLREKETGRKVVLDAKSPDQKRHLLRFLSAAGTHKTAMPDVFSKDGQEDCIVVSGQLVYETPREIRFDYNKKLSYQFA